MPERNIPRLPVTFEETFSIPTAALPDTVFIDSADLQETAYSLIQSHHFNSNVYLERSHQYAVQIGCYEPLSFPLMIDDEHHQNRQADPNRPTRFVLSVSSLQDVYPKALEYLGLYKPLHSNNEHLPFDEAETSLTLGIALHELDAIFNATIQNNTGSNITRTFVTHDVEKLGLYISGTKGLFYPSQQNMFNKNSPKRIYETLQYAAARFRQNWMSIPGVYTQPLAGYALPSPAAKFELINDPLMHNAINNLAYWWTDTSFKAQHDHLASRPDMLSFRELGIVVNTCVGLQIKTRLDSLTFDPRCIESAIEIGDFKTGRSNIAHPFDAEIRLRQAQIMLFAAEKFIEQYLFLDKPIERGKYAPVNIYSWAEMVRPSFAHVKLGYRYFNPKSGKTEILTYCFDDESRAEFCEWLLALGNICQIYKNGFPAEYEKTGIS